MNYVKGQTQIPAEAEKKLLEELEKQLKEKKKEPVIVADPFGSYTGIDALEETEAEDRVINQEVNDAHINKNGIPTQDADDL